MSLNDFVDFTISHSSEPQDTKYVQTNVKWTQISDNENMVYQSGFVRFTGNTLLNPSPDQLFLMSQAVVQIPFGVTVSLKASAGTASFGDFANATYTFTNENVMAIGLKGMAHIFDNCQIQLGNQVNQSSSHLNLFINERLKGMSLEQQRRALSDLLFCIDDMDSYKYDATLLETNNKTVNTNATNLTGGNTYGSKRNEAHIKRMIAGNRDNYDVQARSLFSLTETSTFVQGGLISLNLDDGTPVAVANPTTSASAISQMCFQYVCRLPLAWLHPFFSSVPNLSSLSNFSLTIGTNLAGSTSWVTNYGAAAEGSEMPITSIQANQSVGFTNPFLLSQIYNAGTAGSGCKVQMSNDAATLAVTVKPWIGWAGDNIGQVVLTNGRPRVSNIPCTLQIPVAYLTAPYLSAVMAQSKKLMKWHDYVINTSFTNQAVNANISNVWQIPASRLRKLYLLPFFSAVGKASAVSPILSLVSSAPNTTSAFKLRDLQVSLSGTSIFIDHAITTSFEHFYAGRQMFEGGVNASAIGSYFMPGTTQFDQFVRGGQGLVVDLCRVSDAIVDNLPRNLQVSYRFDCAQGFACTYDMLMVVTFEAEAAIDTRTSENVRI